MSLVHIIIYFKLLKNGSTAKKLFLQEQFWRQWLTTSATIYTFLQKYGTFSQTKCP